MTLELDRWAGMAAGVGMGLTLSGLGAGGSLFIVPVMIFLFDEPVASATGTSLAVVFAAACVGAIGHWRNGRVRPRVALLFGAAAMAGAALGASLHPLVSDRISFALFALALVAASARMLAGNPPGDGQPDAPPSAARLLPMGALLGVVTGFLGVGGGFLIVPVLIWGARLSVRDAIGTSLAVIALSSAAGAASYALQGQVSEALLGYVGGGAVVGALLGAPLSGKLPERPLRLVFAGMAALLAVRFVYRAFWE